MNQDKIGKFIAYCRKNKNLTQQQLAEKIGVSNRSVSKWENGKCMPDLSLFKPLCELLDITINELLSGEKIENNDYTNKLENNILKTIEYSNSKNKKINNTLGIGLLLFGFLIIITAIAIFPIESSWSSVYSIFGTIISLIGISRLNKDLSHIKRVIINFGFFILMINFLLFTDYLNVKINNGIPRFSLSILTMDKTIIYETPFYNVNRCHTNLENEAISISKKQSPSKVDIDKICHDTK